MRVQKWTLTFTAYRFSTESQENSMGERIVFSAHKLGQLAVHTNKRMTLEPFPSSIYKKILLYTTDLNTRVEAGKGQTMGPKAGEHRMSHRVSTLTTVVLCLRLLRLASVRNRCWGDSIEAESAWQTCPICPSIYQFWKSVRVDIGINVWRGMVLQWALLSLRNARAGAFHEASLGICRNASPKSKRAVGTKVFVTVSLTKRPHLRFAKSPSARVRFFIP